MNQFEEKKKIFEKFEQEKIKYETMKQERDQLLVKYKKELQKFKDKPKNQFENNNAFEVALHEYIRIRQEKIDLFEELLKEQKVKTKNNLMKVKENLPSITTKELAKFMIQFLQSYSQKPFISFEDKSLHSFTYYHDYDDYTGYYHFIGVKDSKKEYYHLDKLLNSIHQKKAILFNIGKWQNENLNKNYDLFYYPEIEYNSSDEKCDILKNPPYLNLIDSIFAPISYFKLYPNLKESLWDFLKQKYITKEQEKLNHLKEKVQLLSNEIQTNDTRLQEKISQVKVEFATELKNNKLQLKECTSSKREQEIILNSYLQPIKQVDTEREV